MFAYDAVFRRIYVDHLRAGGTRVSWEYTPGFAAQLLTPLTARLQWGSTGQGDADDWQDTGIQGSDVFSLVDPAQHLQSGKLLRLHYRVQLSWGSTTVVSQPAPALGWLLKSDWLQAREVIRQFRIQNRNPAMVHGWLLKRRWSGTPIAPGQATSNLNPLTGALSVPERAGTAGTEFVGGYFPPVPYSVVPMTLGGHYLEKDSGQARGTIDDMAQRRVVAEAFPMVASNDVFVSDAIDYRYVIHEVQDAAIIRDVPVLLTLNMSQLPFDDPAYQVEVPNQANWGGLENSNVGGAPPYQAPPVPGVLGTACHFNSCQFGPLGSAF
jgi:hypothetical protein